MPTSKKKWWNVCFFSYKPTTICQKNADITYTMSFSRNNASWVQLHEVGELRGGQISFCNFTCRIFMASRVELFVVNEALVSSWVIYYYTTWAEVLDLVFWKFSTLLEDLVSLSTESTKVELFSKPTPTHIFKSYFPPTFEFLNSLLSCF